MAGDFESPEFAAAYDALVANATESCGWATLDVTLSEYTFGGLPEEVPAGMTVVNALNTGEQVHEILVLRVNDDVTMTAEEIAALPEEEAAQYASFVGIGFAFPGAVGHAFLDLTPGRYIALCYLPVGATPEIIAQLPGRATGPGDPRFGPARGGRRDGRRPALHGGHDPGVHGFLTGGTPIEGGVATGRSPFIASGVG